MNCGTLTSDIDAVLLLAVTAVVSTLSIADCCLCVVCLLELSGEDVDFNLFTEVERL